MEAGLGPLVPWKPRIEVDLGFDVLVLRGDDGLES